MNRVAFAGWASPVTIARATSLVFVSTIVALAIAGTYRAYSAVPFFDTWSGYLGFIHKLSDGQPSAFWVQHNEHRIVLSRVLFYVDFYVFNGTGVFLAVMNFVLAGAGTLVFCFLLRRHNRSSAVDVSFVAATSLLIAWLFSGMQFGNFAWAFQSGFFLAQLVPLAALIAMNSAVNRPGKIWPFALVCALGVASIGTMANGILALPLLTVQAVLMRQRPRRIVTLAILAMSTIGAYLVGLESIARHGSMWVAVRDHFADVVLYVLLVLGSPWFYLLRIDAGAQWVALLGGLCFVAFFWSTIKAAVPHDREGRDVALCLFVVYVVCSAMVTAAGRLTVGIEQATASRYTTPVLMAWAAFYVLASPRLLAWGKRHSAIAAAAIVLLAVLLLRTQWDSRNWRPSDPATQDLVGIALALDTRDDQRLEQTFIFLDDVKNESAWAKQRHASFHAVAPFDGVDAQMGQTYPVQAGAKCDVAVESLETYSGARRFIRLRGSFFTPRRSSHRYLVRVLDLDRRMIGLAISGFDSSSNVGRAPALHRDGFQGYIQDEPGRTEAWVDIAEMSCSTRLSLPSRHPAR